MDRRIEYGYAGMDRDQAYMAYIALTCDIPSRDHDERTSVLREIMVEHMVRDREQEKDVDLQTASQAAALAPQINELTDRIAKIDAAASVGAIVGPGQISITVGGSKTILNVVPLTQQESAIILNAMRGVLQLRLDALSAQLSGLV